MEERQAAAAHAARQRSLRGPSQSRGARGRGRGRRARRSGGAAPGKEGRNLDHFCLRVDPFDAEAIIAHLRAHGCDPAPVASRYGAEGQGPSIYVPDPEGNVVELKGPPDTGTPAA